MISDFWIFPWKQQLWSDLSALRLCVVTKIPQNTPGHKLEVQGRKNQHTLLPVLTPTAISTYAHYKQDWTWYGFREIFLVYRTSGTGVIFPSFIFKGCIIWHFWKFLPRTLVCVYLEIFGIRLIVLHEHCHAYTICKICPPSENSVALGDFVGFWWHSLPPDLDLLLVCRLFWSLVALI